MIKRISAFFAAILTITALCSCGSGKTGHSVYSEIYRIYNSLESYTAEGTLTVVSNLTSNSYPFKQYYAAPDKYRIDLANMSYIYSDGTVYLKTASSAGQTLENYIAGDKNYIFVPCFFDEYFKSADASVALGSGTESGFAVLHASGSGGFRAEQNMWVDSKTCLPSKIETLDAEKNPVLTVEFSDFKLNEKIDEGIFEIN